MTWRRNLEFVQNRQWRGAVVECRKELDAALHELIDQANTARQRLQVTDDYPADTRLRDVYEELVALDAEFGDVEWDFREQKLSVITESIELEDMDLGPFKIVFDWSDLSTTKPYQVIALEPNTAGGDDDVTHPHVHDRTLCEGDGRAPIRNALRQGRLCDFFLLVQQVLQTYNAGSAYVTLQNWSGARCSDCGHDCEETLVCQGCESDICEECCCWCSACDGRRCSECRGRCHGCERTHCHDCLSACADCSEDFCEECLTDGCCSECREAAPDESSANAAQPDEGSETPSVAVHTAGLGQVVVSA